MAFCKRNCGSPSLHCGSVPSPGPGLAPQQELTRAAHQERRARLSWGCCPASRRRPDGRWAHPRTGGRERGEERARGGGGALAVISTPGVTFTVTMRGEGGGQRWGPSGCRRLWSGVRQPVATPASAFLQGVLEAGSSLPRRGPCGEGRGDPGPGPPPPPTSVTSQPNRLGAQKTDDQ